MIEGMDELNDMPENDFASEQTELFEAETSFVTNFLSGVFLNAQNGVHNLIATGVNDESHALFFGKSGTEIHVGTDYLDFIISMVQFIEAGQIGVSVRSFVTDKDISNPAVIIQDAMVRREVRGWVVSSEGIMALNSQQVIECYCIDSETGRILDPEPNVAYCDAWDLS